MDTTTLKNPNTAFQTGTDPSLIAATYAPKASTTIDASTLGATPTPFTLPNAPTIPNYTATLGAIPSAASIVSQEGIATPAEQQNNALGSELLTQQQKLGGKAAAQTAAEAQVGLPGLNSQLTDITSQITALKNEANIIPLQDQQNAAGRGITVVGLQPIETGLLRQNTIKALQLSTIANTLQGNIALAQQTADKAVAAQFDPIQAEIDYLQKAIELNAPNMTKEEKAQADTVQAQLQDRQTLLDQQKQDKTTILGWAAEAAKNGANSVVLNQAIALNDPNQALQMLGQYLSDPVAKQQALENLALTRANIGQVNANIAKTNAETAQTLNPALKPATQYQQTTANDASRLVQANQTIEALGSKFASANPLAYGIGSTVPSFLQTSDRQGYEQAKKNFVNAVLRQESGATIPDSEFKNAEAQYFPQPGDTPSTVAQKAANRDLVIRNFVNASGSAYEAPPDTTSQPQTYSLNGKTYVQGPDGLYYPQ